MLNSIFGYSFLFVGLMILALPLILVELSRPRDWLIGSLFLFLGLFLRVENDFLRGSINLFVISIAILYVIMMTEIIQNRWNQLSFDEKSRIRTFDRWFESFRELAQIFVLKGSISLNFLKSIRIQAEKPQKEKKWIRTEFKEKVNQEEVDKLESTSSNKIRNHELTENEETS
tara:strand:- start:660 stop:1178 length:519 start_codon:yes stop_codon:yes gene_type:complete